MEREAALVHGLLDGGMQLEHIEGLVDVEFSDAEGSCVVVG
jgi:hypothetical protein